MFVERFVAVLGPLSITFNSFVLFRPVVRSQQEKNQIKSVFPVFFFVFSPLALICLWVHFAGTSVTSLSDLHDISVCMQTLSIRAEQGK